MQKYQTTAIYLTPFLALDFAAEPILLRVFATLNTEIDNGDLPSIQWIRNDKYIITCCTGRIFLRGRIIAPSTALKVGFQDSISNPIVLIAHSRGLTI